jgi:hypothetical protein
MSAKILESNNYSKFELTPINRPVQKTRKLELSMQKYGWLDAYPAHVVRNGNGKLQIKAGHHRYDVAKKLGIPIKYVECQDDASIHELEGASRKWTAEDYLTSFVNMGNSAYITVKDYHERTGIGLRCCIALLASHSAGSGGSLSDKFAKGIYRIGNMNHSRVVEAIVAQARISGFPHWKNAGFVNAVSKISYAEGFSSEVMKEKIKTYAHFMKKQAGTQDYLKMLDSIYNRQSHEKLPLAFLAEKAAKKRNIATAGR